MASSKYDIALDLEQMPDTSRGYLVRLVGANKRVLDVGCDTGHLGVELAKANNTVHGFEMNETAAEKAREVLADVEVGDLEQTDLVERFGEGRFDIVVFGDVIEHLRDPAPVLRNARRLLAPGGSILISTPNIAHGDVRLALLSGQFTYTPLGILDETHTRFFTRQSLVEFVHQCGYRLVELHRTTLPLFGTEVAIDRANYDDALIARLADDAEATTYQFVIRIVPDDMTDVDSQQALAIDDLTTTVHKIRYELLITRDQLVGTAATAQLLRDRIAELEAASATVSEINARLQETLEAQLAAQTQRCDGLQARLDEVLASTSWRLGSGIVRVAARVRGRR